MMEINFRGREVESGYYVYGDLIHMRSGKVKIKHPQANKGRYYVTPESIAQFVGYDEEGREVYLEIGGLMN